MAEKIEPRVISFPLAPKYDAPELLIWDERSEHWAIRYGASQFLLAEGSGWSMPFGCALYEALAGRPPERDLAHG